MRIRAGAVAITLVLLLAGCAKKKPVRTPPAPMIGAVETGIASWYGHPYHGRRAASGEIYDMEQFTAAHRTLPFGTWVDVLNLGNQRNVRVRINDRGPFVDGRIIDLSRAAARAIQMLGPGTAEVRIQVVALSGPPPATGRFAVQAGAFQDHSNAERLRARLAERYGTARLVPRQGEIVLWRVLVGDEETMERAAALAGQLREELGAAFVVRVDEPLGDGL